MKQNNETDVKQVKRINLNALVSGNSKENAENENGTGVKRGGISHPLHTSPNMVINKSNSRSVNEGNYGSLAGLPAAPAQAPAAGGAPKVSWRDMETMEQCRSKFCELACSMGSSERKAFEESYDDAVLDIRASYPESEWPKHVREFLISSLGQKHEDRRQNFKSRRQL